MPTLFRAQNGLENHQKQAVDVGGLPSRAWREVLERHDALVERTVSEHGRCGAFPADRISKVSAVIDPSTADSVLTA
jgi:hypothetical protein